MEAHYEDDNRFMYYVLLSNFKSILSGRSMVVAL